MVYKSWDEIEGLDVDLDVGENNFVDRRKYVRATIRDILRLFNLDEENIKAKIVIGSSKGEIKYNDVCYILDISRGGAKILLDGLVLKNNLQIEDIFKIGFFLPILNEEGKKKNTSIVNNGELGDLDIEDGYLKDSRKYSRVSAKDLTKFLYGKEKNIECELINGGKSIYRGQLVDISIQGMKLLIEDNNNDVEVGDSIFFNFFLGKKEIFVEGSVVWKQTDSIGIKFNDKTKHGKNMTEQIKGILNAYFVEKIR